MIKFLYFLVIFYSSGTLSSQTKMERKCLHNSSICWYCTFNRNNSWYCFATKTHTTLTTQSRVRRSRSSGITRGKARREHANQWIRKSYL